MFTKRYQMNSIPRYKQRLEPKTTKNIQTNHQTGRRFSHEKQEKRNTQAKSGGNIQMLLSATPNRFETRLLESLHCKTAIHCVLVMATLTEYSTTTMCCSSDQNRSWCHRDPRRQTDRHQTGRGASSGDACDLDDSNRPTAECRDNTVQLQR